MTDRLYYWKPTGGYVYLVKWRDRWRFRGVGATAGRKLSEFAEDHGMHLMGTPGPRRRPATITGMRDKFPTIPEPLRRRDAEKECGHEQA